MNIKKAVEILDQPEKVFFIDAEAYEAFCQVMTYVKSRVKVTTHGNIIKLGEK